MKKLKVKLLFDNGKLKDEVEINVFLFQPRLLIIDGEYYVQTRSDEYTHSEPAIYKTRKDEATTS
jgi:hypothetical protein